MFTYRFRLECILDKKQLRNINRFDEREYGMTVSTETKRVFITLTSDMEITWTLEEWHKFCNLSYLRERLLQYTEDTFATFYKVEHIESLFLDDMDAYHAILSYTMWSTKNKKIKIKDTSKPDTYW
jgi:hypothetical protein